MNLGNLARTGRVDVALGGFAGRRLAVLLVPIGLVDLLLLFAPRRLFGLQFLDLGEVDLLFRIRTENLVLPVHLLLQSVVGRADLFCGLLATGIRSCFSLRRCDSVSGTSNRHAGQDQGQGQTQAKRKGETGR